MDITGSILVLGLSLQRIHWMQPAGSAPPTEFRIYVSPIRYEGGLLLWTGFPEPDALGIYEAQIPLEVHAPIYLWMTAANDGGESSPSNALPFGCDACACDFDFDGIVGSSDLLILYRNFGQRVSPCDAGDCTGDGIVGSRDLSRLGLTWGNTDGCVP